MKQMSKLQLLPQETLLVGRWFEKNGQVVADETCKRIDALIASYLEQVAMSAYGAWEVLYRDPSDGRYWERTYPQGDLHGGGPPQLKYITFEEAKAKYQVGN